MKNIVLILAFCAVFLSTLGSNGNSQQVMASDTVATSSEECLKLRIDTFRNGDIYEPAVYELGETVFQKDLSLVSDSDIEMFIKNLKECRQSDSSFLSFFPDSHFDYNINKIADSFRKAIPKAKARYELSLTSEKLHTRAEELIKKAKNLTASPEEIQELQKISKKARALYLTDLTQDELSNLNYGINDVLSQYESDIKGNSQKVILARMVEKLTVYKNKVFNEKAPLSNSELDEVKTIEAEATNFSHSSSPLSFDFSVASGDALMIKTQNKDNIKHSSKFQRKNTEALHLLEKHRNLGPPKEFLLSKFQTHFYDVGIVIAYYDRLPGAKTWLNNKANGNWRLHQEAENDIGVVVVYDHIFERISKEKGQEIVYLKAIFTKGRAISDAQKVILVDNIMAD